jgi:hypothetical protein
MAHIPFQIRDWQREAVRLEYDPGDGRRNPRWQRVPSNGRPIVTARIVANGEDELIALTGGWVMYRRNGELAHLLPAIAEETRSRMPREWRSHKR